MNWRFARHSRIRAPLGYLRRPTRLALYANRSMDPEIALNQLCNRRTVVEQRHGAAAHVGKRLLRVDA